MNLEKKVKPYQIELRDYIPIYGWLRYQIKGFKASQNAMRDAIQKRNFNEYFEEFGHWTLRTAWLVLYNAGCVYSFILWDDILKLGIVDEIQRLIKVER